MTPARRLRLFLDSNVLTGGIVAPWGLDKAVLSLCAANVCRLVLAEVVRAEVERNLQLLAHRLPAGEPDKLIRQLRRLLQLVRPEVIPIPAADAVDASRHFIRHESDVPVLLSAMAAKPDWLLTNNTRHFTRSVAQRSGLRIGTPREFFALLSTQIQ